jgi:hypothetical protein
MEVPESLNKERAPEKAQFFREFYIRNHAVSPPNTIAMEDSSQ